LESRLVFQFRRGWITVDELKLKIKNLIFHEIEIFRKILCVNDLQENDQIIIRFIDDDVQFYIKQRYKNFNYELILDKLTTEYNSKEYIVMDVIIQLMD